MTNLQQKVMNQFFNASEINGLVYFNSMGEQFVLTDENVMYMLDDGMPMAGGHKVGSIGAVEKFIDARC